jgi:thioredoxin reductase (NADPH)
MLIKTGRVVFHPCTVPTKITTTHVCLRRTDRHDSRDLDVAADFVLLLTGYEMDTTLFHMAGVELEGPNQAPKITPKTMETNVAGIYVAGTAVAGTQMRFRLFIENCHAHVSRIVTAITGHDCPFAAHDVTTSGKYSLPET